MYDDELKPLHRIYCVALILICLAAAITLGYCFHSTKESEREFATAIRCGYSVVLETGEELVDADWTAEEIWNHYDVLKYDDANQRVIVRSPSRQRNRGITPVIVPVMH